MSGSSDQPIEYTSYARSVRPEDWNATWSLGYTGTALVVTSGNILQTFTFKNGLLISMT